MKAKTILAMLALSLMVLSIGSCNTDDIKDIVEYNLEIINNTSTPYDVWIDNPLSTHGYYHAGHVAANQKTIIHELDIGIDYKCNLVNEGASAEPAVHHRIVFSNDADVHWAINP